MLSAAAAATAVGEEVSENGNVGASDYLLKVVNFLWQPNESSYQHSWPVSKFSRFPFFCFFKFC